MNRLIYVIMISSALLSGCTDNREPKGQPTLRYEINVQPMTSAEIAAEELNSRIFTIVAKIDERETVKVPRKTLVNGYAIQQAEDSKTIGDTYIIAKDYKGTNRKFKVGEDIFTQLKLDESIEFSQHMIDNYEVKKGRPR